MRRVLIVGAVLAVLVLIGGGAGLGLWWLAGNDLPAPLAAGRPTATTPGAAPRTTSPTSPSSAPTTAPVRPGPVLLVPGYGGDTALLQPLAARLRADGRTASIVTLPGDATGDITAQARTLDRVVRAAIARGAGSVDVVGFSAGGVVARVWAGRLGGAALARRVVTLGSPHHGTVIAGLAAALLPGECPLACRQLAPDSPLLTGLGPAPAGPRWTSIWTTHDDLVSPADSSRLDGALDIALQDICADDASRHAQLPSDPLVQSLVRAALAAEPLTARPAPSRCAALRVG